VERRPCSAFYRTVEVKGRQRGGGGGALRRRPLMVAAATRDQAEKDVGARESAKGQSQGLWGRFYSARKARGGDGHGYNVH
jgi:hypothetical protein